MKHKGEQSVSCRSCGLDVSPGSKFCSECGNELLPTPSFCSECRSPLANTAKFCGSCGVAVGVVHEQANLEPENAGREIAEWLTPIIGEVVNESLKSVQIFAGAAPTPACTVSFSLGVVDLRLDTTQVDLALLIDPDMWEDVTEVDDQEPETHRHYYLEPDDFDELGLELIEDLAAQFDSEAWKVVRITEDGRQEEELFGRGGLANYFEALVSDDTRAAWEALREQMPWSWSPSLRERQLLEELGLEQLDTDTDDANAVQELLSSAEDGTIFGEFHVEPASVIDNGNFEPYLTWCLQTVSLRKGSTPSSSNLSGLFKSKMAINDAEFSVLSYMVIVCPRCQLQFTQGDPDADFSPDDYEFEDYVLDDCLACDGAGEWVFEL